MRSYWIYILTNVYNGVLYIGVTNNLQRRIYEHREGLSDGFTKKYHVKKLVYVEEFTDQERTAAEKGGADQSDQSRLAGPLRRINEMRSPRPASLGSR